jgi:nucleoid-associated protein YgaU
VNPHPVRRSLSAPRTRGLANASSALALLAMFCRQLAASNRAAWQSVFEPGPATVDQAMAALCGSLALVIALWLLSALLLSLLTALASGSSAASAALARGARVLAPKVLRNAVAALLGVAIAAAPAAADPTGARASGPATTPLHRSQGASQAEGVSRPEGVSQDVGLSPAWTPTAPEMAATPRSDLLPGWLPAAPRDSESESSRPTQRPGSAQPRSTASGSRATGSTPMPSPARRTRIDQDDEIVVRRGDTLWALAERHLGPGATDGEIAVEWPHWFTANRAVIGRDPDHLIPGERLRPPERGAPSEPYRTETKTRPTSGAKHRSGTEPWSAESRYSAQTAEIRNGAQARGNAQSRGGTQAQGSTQTRSHIQTRASTQTRGSTQTRREARNKAGNGVGVEIRGAW